MRHYYNEGQQLFDKNIGLFARVIIFLFTILIYFPLIYTGYWLATFFIAKNAGVFPWMGATLGFAYGCYLVVFFLKGLLVSLKEKNNFLWLLPFLICVAYTCIVPGVITYSLLHHTVTNSVARILIGAGVGYFVYTRYLFMTNVAPLFAMPGYQLGFLIGRLFGITPPDKNISPLMTRNFFLANTKLFA